MSASPKGGLVPTEMTKTRIRRRKKPAAKLTSAAAQSTPSSSQKAEDWISALRHSGIADVAMGRAAEKPILPPTSLLRPRRQGIKRSLDQTEKTDEEASEGSNSHKAARLETGERQRPRSTLTFSQHSVQKPQSRSQTHSSTPSQSSVPSLTGDGPAVNTRRTAKTDRQLRSYSGSSYDDSSNNMSNPTGASRLVVPDPDIAIPSITEDEPQASQFSNQMSEPIIKMSPSPGVDMYSITPTLVTSHPADGLPNDYFSPDLQSKLDRDSADVQSLSSRLSPASESSVGRLRPKSQNEPRNYRMNDLLEDDEEGSYVSTPILDNSPGQGTPNGTNLAIESLKKKRGRPTRKTADKPELSRQGSGVVSGRVKKAPQGRRKKTSGDPELQDLYNRQAEYRADYRDLVKNVKHALNDLAERDLETLHNDPEAYKKPPEYQVVTDELARKLEHVKSVHDKRAEMDTQYAEKKRDYNADLIRRMAQARVAELQEVAVAKLLREILNVTRASGGVSSQPSFIPSTTVPSKVVESHENEEDTSANTNTDGPAGATSNEPILKRPRTISALPRAPELSPSPSKREATEQPLDEPLPKRPSLLPSFAVTEEEEDEDEEVIQTVSRPLRRQPGRRAAAETRTATPDATMRTRRGVQRTQGRQTQDFDEHGALVPNRIRRGRMLYDPPNRLQVKGARLTEPGEMADQFYDQWPICKSHGVSKLLDVKDGDLDAEQAARYNVHPVYGVPLAGSMDPDPEVLSQWSPLPHYRPVTVVKEDGGLESLSRSADIVNTYRDWRDREAHQQMRSIIRADPELQREVPDGGTVDLVEKTLEIPSNPKLQELIDAVDELVQKDLEFTKDKTDNGTDKAKPSTNKVSGLPPGELRRSKRETRATAAKLEADSAKKLKASSEGSGTWISPPRNGSGGISKTSVEDSRRASDSAEVSKGAAVSDDWNNNVIRRASEGSLLQQGVPTPRRTRTPPLFRESRQPYGLMLLADATLRDEMTSAPYTQGSALPPKSSLWTSGDSQYQPRPAEAHRPPQSFGSSQYLAPYQQSQQFTQPHQSQQSHSSHLLQQPLPQPPSQQKQQLPRLNTLYVQPPSMAHSPPSLPAPPAPPAPLQSFAQQQYVWQHQSHQQHHQPSQNYHPQELHHSPQSKQQSQEGYPPMSFQLHQQSQHGAMHYMAPYHQPQAPLPPPHPYVAHQQQHQQQHHNQHQHQQHHQQPYIQPAPGSSSSSSNSNSSSSRHRELRPAPPQNAWIAPREYAYLSSAVPPAQPEAMSPGSGGYMLPPPPTAGMSPRRLSTSAGHGSQQQQQQQQPAQSPSSLPAPTPLSPGRFYPPPQSSPLPPPPPSAHTLRKYGRR